MLTSLLKKYLFLCSYLFPLQRENCPRSASLEIKKVDGFKNESVEKQLMTSLCLPYQSRLLGEKRINGVDVLRYVRKIIKQSLGTLASSILSAYLDLFYTFVGLYFNIYIYFFLIYINYNT